MPRILLAIFLIMAGLSPAAAQTTLQDILQTHAAEVAKPGRRSVPVVLDDLVASGLPQVTPFLEAWQDKRIWDLNRRITAVEAIARRPEAAQLAPLVASIADEPDAALKARKTILANAMTARFGDTPEDRIAAIESLSTDVSVETRAVLNQILTTTPGVAATLPDDLNIARILTPGDDITVADAYALLVTAELAEPATSRADIREALAANVTGGTVGGVPLAQLNTDEKRAEAYGNLAATGRDWHRSRAGPERNPSRHRRQFHIL